MWDEAGARLIINAVPPAGCMIGLYAAGDGRKEITSIRGVYKRQPIASAPWPSESDGAGWTVTGPAVTFTGFVSREKAIGYTLYQADAVIFSAPFADSSARALQDESDRLIVTPSYRLHNEV